MNTLNSMNALLLLSLLVATLVCHQSYPSEYTGGQVTVVLIGSTGDLAKRYLWPALFNLYVGQEELKDGTVQLRVFACSRQDKSKASGIIKEALEEKLCKSKSLEELSENSSCPKLKHKFEKLFTYHKLKSQDDYKSLKTEVEKSLLEKEEVKRVVYLSVPPFAYESISELVHKFLRPGSDVPLHVIFEKPFGHNLASAMKLSTELNKYLNESEMFRIDHYLGKQSVNKIVEFRQDNQNILKRLWNNNFIESVEVVVKEKVDCQGRTEYYDQYGVILDMLQNHLTEILARITMELPKKQAVNTDFEILKCQALHNIIPPDLDDAVLGQYADYNSHVAEDKLSKRPQSDSNENLTKYYSNMPTFAAVLLQINSSQWHNVPFVLVSGKKLKEKYGYVKISFKADMAFEVSRSERHEETKNWEENAITFIIHSQKYKGPAVLLSGGLRHLDFNLGKSWTEIETTRQQRVFKPLISNDAYSTLIKKIYHGDKGSFVGYDDLMELWRIWSPLQSLQSKIKPIIHDENNLQELDFRVSVSDMKIISNKLEVENPAINSLNDLHDYISYFPDGISEMTSYAGQKHITTTSVFLNASLTTGHVKSVIAQLAETVIDHIKLAALKAEPFHLVLPGGKTIVPFLDYLCKAKSSVPWKFLHIWLGDERCVPVNDSSSNFAQIHDNLVQCVRLPCYNIHPMPVNLGNNICIESDSGSRMYRDEVQTWLPSFSFNFVILGLGSDGHIASLFPGDDASISSMDYVTVTNKGPKNNIMKRMTMTPSLLNKAKKIVMLVLGNQKRQILKGLQDAHQDHHKFPVFSLKPINGTVEWFIDDAALGNEL